MTHCACDGAWSELQDSKETQEFGRTSLTPTGLTRVRSVLCNQQSPAGKGQAPMLELSLVPALQSSSEKCSLPHSHPDPLLHRIRHIDTPSRLPDHASNSRIPNTFSMYTPRSPRPLSIRTLGTCESNAVENDSVPNRPFDVPSKCRFFSFLYESFDSLQTEVSLLHRSSVLDASPIGNAPPSLDFESFVVDVEKHVEVKIAASPPSPSPPSKEVHLGPCIGERFDSCRDLPLEPPLHS